MTDRERNTEIVSEEYEINRLEYEISKRMKRIMHELGAWRALDNTYNPPYEKSKHYWRISWHKDSQKRNNIRFSNHHYNPHDSEIVYGPVVIVSEKDTNDEGTSRLYDNSNSPVDIESRYSSTTTVHSESTHELNQDYHFDVKSNTKLSGSYGSVAIEQEIEVAFGFKIETNKSETEGRTTEESLGVDFTIPAGKKLLLSLEKTELETNQDFSIKGVLDFGMWFDFENWAESKWWKNEGEAPSFNNMLEFEQFIEGYNVKYPKMRTFLDECSDQVYEDVKWILNKENRTINVTGVKNSKFDNNVRVKTQEVV